MFVMHRDTGSLTVDPRWVSKIYRIFNVDGSFPVTPAEHFLRRQEVTVFALKVGRRCKAGWEATVVVQPNKTLYDPTFGNGLPELYAAQLLESSSGAPKLLQADPGLACYDACIVHLTLGAGFEGGNEVYGDIASWTPSGQPGLWKPGSFKESPLIPLAIGECGTGWRQYVGILPRGEVLRVKLTGRLGSREAVSYYLFDGAMLRVTDPKGRDIGAESGEWPELPGFPGIDI